MMDKRSIGFKEHLVVSPDWKKCQEKFLEKVFLSKVQRAPADGNGNAGSARVCRIESKSSAAWRFRASGFTELSCSVSKSSYLIILCSLIVGVGHFFRVTNCIERISLLFSCSSPEK